MIVCITIIYTFNGGCSLVELHLPHSLIHCFQVLPYYCEVTSLSIIDYLLLFKSLALQQHEIN